MHASRMSFLFLTPRYGFIMTHECPLKTLMDVELVCDVSYITTSQEINCSMLIRDVLCCQNVDILVVVTSTVKMRRVRHVVVRFCRYRVKRDIPPILFSVQFCKLFSTLTLIDFMTLSMNSDRLDG
jgi:hypothetical protein